MSEKWMQKNDVQDFKSRARRAEQNNSGMN